MGASLGIQRYVTVPKYVLYWGYIDIGKAKPLKILQKLILTALPIGKLQLSINILIPNQLLSCQRNPTLTCILMVMGSVLMDFYHIHVGISTKLHTHWGFVTYLYFHRYRLLITLHFRP